LLSLSNVTKAKTFERLFYSAGRFGRWIYQAHDKGFLLDAAFGVPLLFRLLITGHLSILYKLATELKRGSSQPVAFNPATLEEFARELKDSSRAQYLAGLALMAKNCPIAAEQAFERALRLRPGFRAAEAALAGVQVHLGFFAKAERNLVRVVEQSPELVRPWVWLGNARVALGRYDEATFAYRKALALRPRSVEILFTLADHLLYRHQEAEGCDLLLTAAHINAEVYRQFWNGDRDARPSTALLRQMMLCQAYIRIGDRSLTSGRGAEMIAYYARAKQAQEVAVGLVRDTAWAIQHGLSSLDVRLLPPIWTARISHISYLGQYLKMMILGWSPKRPVRLLAPKEAVCNDAYLECWREGIEIVRDPDLIKKMRPACFVLGDWHTESKRMPSGDLLWWQDAGVRSDGEWERLGKPPLVNLPPELREAGYRTIEAAGIPRGAWFVALHIRESGFYGEGEHPGWEFRNPSLSAFAAAIATIRARGGYVVRMGDPTMTPYPPTEGIFDYALSPVKSDWMDVFLCAESRFFIGSTSGLFLAAHSFGVPCVLTNWISFFHKPMGLKHVYLPKLIERMDGSGSLLSFRDMFKPEQRWINADGRILIERGLRPIDNTAEEIAEAVEEMMLRLAGAFALNAEETDLMARFTAISEEMGVVETTPICAAFLRRHADLLD
jgi:putative glycosyltransferase (TIGR04372 family)